MTIYRGYKTGHLFQVKKDDKHFDPEPSQKVFNHSPRGFSWGYNGSGPAQLALALLLDVGVSEHEAVRLHQPFKAERIAPLDINEAWSMSDEEIRQWVESLTLMP